MLNPVLRKKLAVSFGSERTDSTDESDVVVIALVGSGGCRLPYGLGKIGQGFFHARHLCFWVFNVEIRSLDLLF